MSSYSGTTFTLNTGAKIPGIGFGTWQDKDAQEDAVYEAIKAGYRHIDTARVYGTEPGVAAGVKKLVSHATNSSSSQSCGITHTTLTTWRSSSMLLSKI